MEIIYQNPPKNAVQFVAWLNDKLLLVPEAARSTATIELDVKTDYEVSYTFGVKISYQREAVTV